MPADSVEDILKPLFPGAIRISGVNEKPFAFVEYGSHSEAAEVVNASVDGSRIVSLPSDLGGATLAIGWGKVRS